MKIDREAWILCVGMAGSGKTSWIREHLKKPAPFPIFVLDFNCNDYQDLQNKCEIWNVQEGTKDEIERFLKVPYFGTKKYHRGNSFVVLEEADCYLPNPTPFIARFVNSARNIGIGCIVSAKRAKAVQPVYRNRFTHIVAFGGTLPEDIEYLEEWAGTGKGSLSFLTSIGCTCATFENPNPPCKCGKKGQYVIILVNQHKISEVKRL